MGFAFVPALTTDGTLTMTDAGALSLSITSVARSATSVDHDAALAGPSGHSKGLTFGEILSDINPLQYLPVVGTIYRAMTGDAIPKPLREAGSVVVSSLLGGPVGAAISLATLAFEKMTGIDFEDVEQNLLGTAFGKPSTAATPDAAAQAPAPEPTPHSGPWTISQLAAYGVVTLQDSTLQQGDLVGADVLNALQLGSSLPAGIPA